MTETIQYDLFIVYADGDADWVERILIPSLRVPSEKILTKEGFRPGIEKVTEFNRAVTSSRYTLLILSPTFLDDEWAMYTKSIADYSRVKKPDHLLPLILKPCELPQELNLLIPFDCTKKARWQHEIGRLQNLLNQSEASLGSFRDSSPPVEPFNEMSNSQYSFHTFPKSVQQLVAKDKMKAAFDQVGRRLESNYWPDLYDRFIQLSRRYHGFEKDKEDDKISSKEFQDEVDLLSQKLLTLLREINSRIKMTISPSLISIEKSDTSLEESISRYSARPSFPPLLKRKITEFLTSLPGIDDSNTRQVLIYSAGLDVQLQHQITFAGSSTEFFQLLMLKLISYGILEDGRNPIEAVLEAAKHSIGLDRRAYCDTLIKELREILNLEGSQ